MNDLLPGSPEKVGVSVERLLKLENYCSDWISTGVTPALSVLAARHGTIFLHKTWGKLTPALDSPPVQLDSMFGMASCSKPVTATAVMILVEQGLIDLHQPLLDFLPEFKGPDTEKITIHNLLSHTSGLPCSTELNSITAAENGLEFQPGSKVVYSSVGFDILGEVIESISGKSFNSFTTDFIFRPLGMHNTTFIHMGLNRDNCVQRRPGTTYDWPEEAEGKTSASSTLWSTAHDMGIYLQTFLNKGRFGDYELLTQSRVDDMTHNQVPGISRELVDGVQIPASGLGWFMLGSARFPDYPRSFSPSSYGHSGASGAFIWVDPAFDLIGAFLFTKIKEDFRPLNLFVDTLYDCIIDGKSTSD